MARIAIEKAQFRKEVAEREFAERERDLKELAEKLKGEKVVVEHE